MGAEIEFTLRGIRWTEKTFSDALRRVVALHRTLTTRRVAYHLGVTEKALRDLKKRSALAARIMEDFEAEVVSLGEKSARFRDYSYSYLCPDGDTKKIFEEASKERERQNWIRWNRKSEEKAEACKTKANAIKQRHAEVQSCKRDGMTQTMTAVHLAISLSTVKRYWPENLPKKPGKKRGRPSLTADEKLIREFMRQTSGSRTPALHTAQLMEAEGRRVPASLLALAEKELTSPE